LPDDVPGICVVSREGMDLEGAGLEDIAPTILEWLGVRTGR
jgi:hypothetical protein